MGSLRGSRRKIGQNTGDCWPSSCGIELAVLEKSRFAPLFFLTVLPLQVISRESTASKRSACVSEKSGTSWDFCPERCSSNRKTLPHGVAMDAMERFARFVGLPTDRGCMEWQGAKYPQGYGAFKLWGKTIGAHRAALIVFGVEILGGMDVRQKCRNRLCVNPDHLVIGSRVDTMQAASRDGRLPKRHRKRIAATLMEMVEAARRNSTVLDAAKSLGISRNCLTKHLLEAGYPVSERRKLQAKAS